MVRRSSHELLYGTLAVAGVAVWYVYAAWRAAPMPSSLVGLALGIIGFLLMLSTETLYTLRKRLRGFTRWPTHTWLQIHIVTGIVGSFLVLLHTGWHFRGVAGWVMLLTAIVVASGFVGRYIYTAVPRNLDGAAIAVRELEAAIAEANEELRIQGPHRLGGYALSAAPVAPQSAWLLIFGRGWLRWQQKRRIRQALRKAAGGRFSTRKLERLLLERYRLSLQVHSVAASRRLLSIWHMLHIPLGAVLFTLAFVHVIGALYYTALSR